MQSPLLDVWLGWLIVTSVIVTSVSGPSPRMMWVCSFVVPGVKSLISFTRWISVLLPSWMPRQSWAPLSPENRITDCVPRPCSVVPAGRVSMATLRGDGVTTSYWPASSETVAPAHAVNTACSAVRSSMPSSGIAPKSRGDEQVVTAWLSVASGSFSWHAGRMAARTTAYFMATPALGAVVFLIIYVDCQFGKTGKEHTGTSETRRNVRQPRKHRWPWPGVTRTESHYHF